MGQQLSMDRAFAQMGYNPHAVQRSVHTARSHARFRVVDAGRRTGKSNLGGHELAYEAMRARLRKGLSATGRRAEYWIVGPEYSDGEKEFRVLWDSLKKMGATFDQPGTYYSLQGGNMDISLFKGAYQVHVMSAKMPNNLVGEALEGVILAEAAKLKANIWPKFIRPMLADYKGWGMMTSTPEGKNWFYEQWRMGQDPSNEEYWSVRTPSWSNPILFPQGRRDPEILSLERGMSQEKFNQEIGAEFTEFVGRVYKDYDEETNVTDILYDPRKPLYVAADFGYTNPNVLLFIQVGTWGDVYVIGEYYKRERTTPMMIAEVKDDWRLGGLARAATALYPDPEDPGAAAQLAEAFGWTIKGNTGGLLNTRIELIRKALKPQAQDPSVELEDGHPDKLPKLWFDRSCANTNRDFLDYRYPESREEAIAAGVESPEKPVKANDHGPEALSRFFGGYFHAEKPRKRARVSTAQMIAA